MSVINVQQAEKTIFTALKGILSSEKVQIFLLSHLSGLIGIIVAHKFGALGAEAVTSLTNTLLASAGLSSTVLIGVHGYVDAQVTPAAIAAAANQTPAQLALAAGKQAATDAAKLAIAAGPKLGAAVLLLALAWPVSARADALADCALAKADFASGATATKTQADLDQCLQDLQLTKPMTIGKTVVGLGPATGLNFFSVGESSAKKAVITGPNNGGAGLVLDFSWDRVVSGATSFEKVHAGVILMGAGAVQAGSAVGTVIAGAYVGFQPAVNWPMVSIGPGAACTIAAGLPCTFVLLFAPAWVFQVAGG